MTTYRVLVAAELLPEIQNSDRLPEGFRPIRVVGESVRLNAYYVEVQDDNAPADLEGKLVEVTITAEHDRAIERTKTVITDRRLAPQQ